MDIDISVKDMVFKATIDNSPTAKAIAAALPLTGSANVWGDEIYFEIPVEIPLAEEAVEEVAVGGLAYWPTGNALCIFFGPTPISKGQEPRAYSPVNIFGQITGGTAGLKSVPQGASVTISVQG